MWGSGQPERRFRHAQRGGDLRPGLLAWHHAAGYEAAVVRGDSNYPGNLGDVPIASLAHCDVECRLIEEGRYSRRGKVEPGSPDPHLDHLLGASQALRNARNALPGAESVAGCVLGVAGLPCLGRCSTRLNACGVELQGFFARRRIGPERVEKSLQHLPRRARRSEFAGADHARGRSCSLRHLGRDPLRASLFEAALHAEAPQDASESLGCGVCPVGCHGRNTTDLRSDGQAICDERDVINSVI